MASLPVAQRLGLDGTSISLGRSSGTACTPWCLQEPFARACGAVDGSGDSDFVSADSGAGDVPRLPPLQEAFARACGAVDGSGDSDFVSADSGAGDVPRLPPPHGSQRTGASLAW